jgi:hypothetical protein
MFDLTGTYYSAFLLSALFAILALVFTATPYPDFVEELIRAGGLVEYARRKLV